MRGILTYVQAKQELVRIGAMRKCKEDMMNKALALLITIGITVEPPLAVPHSSQMSRVTCMALCIAVALIPETAPISTLPSTVGVKRPLIGA